VSAAAPRLQLTLDDTVGHPALDTAISRVLLERVDRGELPATLRLSRPARIVAFSSRDARAPGYDEAVAAAAREGFSPVVRLAGGRAAVFTESTIAFAWSVPSEGPAAGIAERFGTLSACLAEAFTELGADARVGEVAGEYCPGAYSVNVGGRRKIAGVGQRLLRRAAHTGGVVVVDGAALLNRVLVPVYAAMDVSFDPAATGALREEVDVGFEQVRTAIAEAFARRFDVTEWRLDDRTRRLAEVAAAEHLVDVRRVAS
jgi:octanoyl-[GcvH]:protein N-octanoyltransferase